jgi:molybdopterin-guanine dinucleotide biosynthesis protein A
MRNQTKVAGVVLAGGLARRMNNQDKGLVLYQGRPLVAYAVEAISTAVDQVLINANRNQEQYQQFGYPVIVDQTDSFDGPLAGMLAALSYSEADILLVMPCDSPLIVTADLQRLLRAQVSAQADIAVAFDGKRLHPVFLVLRTSLKDSLKAYLDSGQRKIDRWFERHHFVPVDFSDKPEVFLNINTLEELTALEASDDKT